MAPAEPLLIWTDPPRELVGFLASYLPLGAIGFQFAVLVPAVGRGGPGATVLHDASHRAARIGVIGALCAALALLISVLNRAGHTGLGFEDTVLLLRGQVIQRLGLVALMALGFSLALARVRGGWVLAAIGTLWIQLGNLPGVFSGRWPGIINPLHVLGGSLWIGTLFVLMVAGVGAINAATAGEAHERNAAIGLLVRKFSAIALIGAGLLGATGIVTAWRHLHRWSSLWTTPYGWTLDAKLLVVLCIIKLGHHHWKRVGPTLGTPESITAFRRTAWIELRLAGLVLLITSVLVSLPTPGR
ncbi:MAG: copper resistance D family protein [Gemmatimonadales bacterium]